MFSNTAYEALYRYLGLVFHSGSVSLITSEPFFKGLVLLIFGALFLFTSWQLASRHIFGNFVQRHNVPLSKFVKIAFCLVLGISLLKVGGKIRIEDYANETWSQNGYVKDRLNDIQDEYEVSFVFDILSRSAEGVAKYLSYAGDYIFGGGKDSYLKNPFAYAKAIMIAGAATIDNEKLRSMTSSYTSNCLQRVLPDVAEFDEKSSRLDRFFKRDIFVEAQLAKITLSNGQGGNIYTCKDLKNELREGLYQHADSKGLYVASELESWQAEISKNAEVSAMLVNHYRNEREGFLGMQKGSASPGTTGTVFQALGRIVGWDGFLTIFSLGKATNLHGASESASRAKEFSELLTRAPHLKGILMMLLIGLFPWLIFFVVYGKWQVLVWWFWAYFSVCLWTPIWTIMYHIMNNIALAGDSLSSFAPLSDGISLYSSQVVMDRIYYLYSVFSMAQIVVPVFTTGLALYLVRPMLSGFHEESKPEFVDGGVSALSTGVGLASGMPEIGVANAAK